ncbi:MAG: ferritin family protein [Chloroflexi bacterium]|nr:ferritin family protein [Chloroflexota bacterium]
MTSRLTLKEVLQKAIEKEIGSQELYRDLGRRTADKTAKDTFEELVRQEEGHQQLLERYLRGELKGGALRVEQVIDYKIAENTGQTEITPEMTLKEIFLLAANREKMAHEAYLALADVHPAGRVKTLLEDLASQELTHKHRLEFLYTEVAFPQTAGG